MSERRREQTTESTERRREKRRRETGYFGFSSYFERSLMRSLFSA